MGLVKPLNGRWKLTALSSSDLYIQYYCRLRRNYNEVGRQLGLAMYIEAAADRQTSFFTGNVHFRALAPRSNKAIKPEGVNGTLCYIIRGLAHLDQKENNASSAWDVV